QAPYFDEVWVDERPDWRNPVGFLHLRRRLRSERFTRVYDFQTRLRSSSYFWLMRSGGEPEWSGIAPGASHPHANPDRDAMHTLDKQEEQLRMAGVTEPVGLPDLSCAATDVSRFNLPSDYSLLIPGGSSRHPAKRWPIANYAALAKDIAASGAAPVVIGGPDEHALGRAIVAAAPATRDLTGQTGFGDIVALG